MTAKQKVQKKAKRSAIFWLAMALFVVFANLYLSRVIGLMLSASDSIFVMGGIGAACALFLADIVLIIFLLKSGFNWVRRYL